MANISRGRVGKSGKKILSVTLLPTNWRTDGPKSSLKSCVSATKKWKQEKKPTDDGRRDAKCNSTRPLRYPEYRTRDTKQYGGGRWDRPIGLGLELNDNYESVPQPPILTREEY